MPETSAQKPRKRARNDANQSGDGKVSPKPAKRPKSSGVDIDAVHRPNKAGRSGKYTPELAAEICERLSNGEPLRQICRSSDRFPVWQKIYEWMERDAELAGAIARAREVGQDAIAEEIYALVEKDPERILSEGGGRVDAGYVQWVRVQADIKLKLLAKWNPKRYGDRVQLAGDKENPLQIDATVQAKTMFDSLLQNLELRKQAE
jgi:hypothetical protein